MFQCKPFIQMTYLSQQCYYKKIVMYQYFCIILNSCLDERLWTMYKSFLPKLKILVVGENNFYSNFCMTDQGSTLNPIAVNVDQAQAPSFAVSFGYKGLHWNIHGQY